MHFCSKFGNCNFNWWWVMAWTSSKWGKFWVWSSVWLEGHDHSSHKTIEILTKVIYISGANLVILAYTVAELSWGQTWWRTDWRTDGQTQAATIPEGQNWPQVKTSHSWYQKIEFLIWPKLFSDIWKSIFWYQKLFFDVRNHYMISYFLISETRIWNIIIL